MRKKNGLAGAIKEWAVIFGEALAIVLILFLFCWPLRVFGTSMEDTLKTGDRIAVSKFISLLGNYHRGDMITFTLEYIDDSMSIKGKKVIKRIIAVDNEHLEIISGAVYINGELLEEPYAGGIMMEEVDIIVPEGYVYVLGDNRGDSVDSRTLGPILRESITGKVIFKWYPFNEMSLY